MKFEHGYWLPDTEQHFQQFLAHGPYQGATQFFVLEILKHLGYGRRSAVDAGANVGLWSVPLSEHFEMMHCFEPLPANFECLARNIEGRRAKAYLCGLSDVAGEAALFTPAGLPNSGAPSFMPIADADQVPARLLPLDAFSLSDVDLIKIDVQGFEPRVLEGARATIGRSRPLIILEDLPPGRNKATADSLGYEKLFRFKKDVVFAPIDGRDRAANLKPRLERLLAKMPTRPDVGYASWLTAS